MKVVPREKKMEGSERQKYDTIQNKINSTSQ